MGKICLLSDSLVSKIAAGEVIERPASVVKELVENSIDAGSKKIFIQLVEAGITRILVSDDGSGMEESDAKICAQRHTTSKIYDEKDLYQVRTLGFRGEALASISAVSELIITTRTRDMQTGLRVTQHSVDKIAANPGTTVEVRNLFYRTPARKKFLRSMQHELTLVVDVVMRYALANPLIHFRLSHNDKELLNAPSTQNTLTNLGYIYPRSITKGLIQVDAHLDGIGIMGFISQPQVNRSDRSYQTIFVNHRHVRSKIINDAIYEAYHGMLFTKRHPIIFLHIDIDPGTVDANVHPSKSIVKFSNELRVMRAVTSALRKSLLSHNLAPELSSREYDKPLAAYAKPKKQRYGLDTEIQKPLMVKEATHLPKPDFKVLGQVNREYIVVKTRHGIEILDQHAAMERVNYEIFMKEKKDGAIRKQEILGGRVMTLTPKQGQVIEKNQEALSKIGISIENFGGNDFLLKSIPVIFGRIGKEQLLNDIIDAMSEARSKAGDTVEERIIRMSCRKSVKAGDELTLPQMEKLYLDLLACENPYTCPHGRPTSIKLSLDELERKFKRV